MLFQLLTLFYSQKLWIFDGESQAHQLQALARECGRAWLTLTPVACSHPSRFFKIRAITPFFGTLGYSCWPKKFHTYFLHSNYFFLVQDWSKFYSLRFMNKLINNSTFCFVGLLHLFFLNFRAWLLKIERRVCCVRAESVGLVTGVRVRRERTMSNMARLLTNPPAQSCQS